ncbi:hypothetical protein P4O66_022502, partial [Electrophorus voltai]
MEVIRLPLKPGTIDDISQGEGSSQTDESINSQKTSSSVHTKEALMEIDYSNLNKDLKDALSEEEIKAEMSTFQQKLAERQKLQRVSVRNMKTMENISLITSLSHTAVHETCSSESFCCSGFLRTAEPGGAIPGWDQLQLCGTRKEIQANGQPVWRREDRGSLSAAFCHAQFLVCQHVAFSNEILYNFHLGYKPAPFFVLDEIDAALDNTNIGKVCGQLHKGPVQNFQAIVTSLKEEFYTKADSLIRVYPE